MPEKSDYVTCSNCGEKMFVPRAGRLLGRKPLFIGVKNICDTLVLYGDIALAAKTLRCSRGYIYGELAKHGMTPKEVIGKK